MLQPTLRRCNTSYEEAEKTVYVVFFSVSFCVHLLNIVIHALGLYGIGKTKKITNSRLLWSNISIVAILFSVANFIRSIFLYVILKNTRGPIVAGIYSVNGYNCSNHVLSTLELIFLMFMLLLTMDQMAAGFSPLQYRAKLSFFYCCSLIIMVWTGGGTLLVLLMLYYRGSFPQLFTIVFLVLLIAMFIFMAVTYARLYMLLKKQQIIQCVSSVVANCNRTSNNNNINNNRNCNKLRGLFCTCLGIFVIFTFFFFIPTLLYLFIGERISPFQYNVFYVPVLVSGFMLVGLMYIFCQGEIKRNVKCLFFSAANTNVPFNHDKTETRQETQCCHL